MIRNSAAFEEERMAFDSARDVNTPILSLDDFYTNVVRVDDYSTNGFPPRETMSCTSLQDFLLPLEMFPNLRLLQIILRKIHLFNGDY